MRYYPDNGPSHFFTRLPQTIELNDEYEVGLSEIMFHNNHKFLKVGEEECLLVFGANQQTKTVSEFVPAGSYRTGEQLADVLNVMMAPHFKENDAIRFRYNPLERKMTLTFKETDGYVQFNTSLQQLLGFDERVYTASREGCTKTGSKSVEEIPRAIYVYCDIVRPRPVGDVMAPLLRIVTPGKRSEVVVHHVFEKPNYIPLSRFQFNTVEVLLTNDSGENISFEEGKSIVTLHLRRRRPEGA